MKNLTMKNMVAKDSRLVHQGTNIKPTKNVFERKARNDVCKSRLVTKELVAVVRLAVDYCAQRRFRPVGRKRPLLTCRSWRPDGLNNGGPVR